MGLSGVYILSFSHSFFEKFHSIYHSFYVLFSSALVVHPSFRSTTIALQPALLYRQHLVLLYQGILTESYILYASHTFLMQLAGLRH